MRKNLGIRLITVGSVVVFGYSACTVAVKDDNSGTGGSTTAAGTTGTGTTGTGTTGSSGGSGVAGSSSTGGAAGQGGGSTGGGGIDTSSLGDASLPSYRDAAWDSADAACINDSTEAGETANPDLCPTLNGADGGPDCYDTSPGRQLCDLMHENARPGAFKVFFNCIDGVTKNDPCADLNKVSVCFDTDHWPTGCQVGKVVVSNGKQWDCTNLVAKCPDDDAGNGFTLPECDFIMNVFNDDARTKIFDCYLTKNQDPATCKADFTDCVYNPDQL
jgi:hypothetical protein